MDVVRLISESFGYAKDAIWGRWVRWLLLLVSTIIFPFMYGYTVRVMSGTKPAPELEGWIGLFVDGIKLIVITIVYAIPLMVLTVLPFLMYFIPVSATVTPAGSGPEPLLSPELAIFAALAILIIFILAAVIIGILSTFAAVRFARTGKMREAFRIRTLLTHIGTIGWIRCFIALLVMIIVIAIVEFVLALIPLIGPVLLFLLTPAFIIFSARYVALLYESAPAPV
ncbi:MULTISPECIES: DUF4013 domain-containing protein [Methanoculleus]|uniref:DUF4013 domain-containing protein n=2 Tax=Methanoculleus TaxID=45989 RepID=A3CUF1_METMJ|nr:MULTISPECIES: DUF4013 domain-containing protein [Methanoculleus]ABN57001.1 conserved hypothetical protein [Methanoculleus marisnigri JR1]MCC7555565.1 DUF4013 domain-containing protein [Methanoculleus marisnigri]UYU18420.1 DUF4013 domain-containing protein [Methanoculleus submarinus]